MPIFEGDRKKQGWEEKEPPHLTTWHTITSTNGNGYDKQKAPEASQLYIYKV